LIQAENGIWDAISLMQMALTASGPLERGDNHKHATKRGIFLKNHWGTKYQIYIHESFQRYSAN
jgi:hypothetical protein